LASLRDCRRACASFGEDPSYLFTRLAVFADKVLRGGRLLDLPVEWASKFELVVNLRTARSLGLTVSSTLLARAVEVIE
jgi:putative ABC transport system substrate-binding protein